MRVVGIDQQWGALEIELVVGRKKGWQGMMVGDAFSSMPGTFWPFGASSYVTPLSEQPQTLPPLSVDQ